jgi:flagellar hook-length control protein FliK
MLPNSVFDLASPPKASGASKTQARPDAQNQKPAQAFQPMLEATRPAPERLAPKALPSREVVDASAKAPQIKADTKPRTDEPKPKAADSETITPKPEQPPVTQAKPQQPAPNPDMQAQNLSGHAEAEEGSIAEKTDPSSSGSTSTVPAHAGSLPSASMMLDPVQAKDAEQAEASADMAGDLPTTDGVVIALPDASLTLPMPVALALTASDPAHIAHQGEGEGAAPAAQLGALLQAGMAVAEDGGDDAVIATPEGEAANGEAASGKPAAPAIPLLAGGAGGTGEKPASEPPSLKSLTASSGGITQDAGLTSASAVAGQDAPSEIKPGMQANGTQTSGSIVPQIGHRLAPAEQGGAERFAGLADAPYGLRGLDSLGGLDALGGLGDFHQTVDRLLQDSRVQTHAMAQQQHLRPTPLQMLPIEIGMQAMRGSNSFQIRLDPAELGRVDVKLEVNTQGEVSAHLIVERPETLQMLRRDSTTLQYAFEQAGLKSSQDGLSFSLKGEGQNGQNQNQNGSTPGQKQEDDPLLKTQIEHLALRRVMIPHSSVDRVI